MIFSTPFKFTTQTRTQRGFSSIAFSGRRLVRFSCVLTLLICSHASCQDWPQILGPNRNAIADGETLVEKWPETGPKRIWTAAVGEGFAGPIVVGDRVFVYHLIDRKQTVQALDRTTGKEIWTEQWDSEYRGGMDGDAGPKCVPLHHDGQLYLHGPDGTLTCLSAAEGKQIWQKPTKDYGFGRGFFGVGSSPIVMDEKLIVNVGGRKSAVVAFDLNDGSEIWKSFDDRASYSSPIKAKLGDKPILAVVSRLHLLGMDPKSGEVLFKFEFGARGPTVNASMPVYADGHLFVTAAYGIGGLLVDVSGDEAKEVWRNKTAFASHYSTPVYHKGHLYGVSGREDLRSGSLRCVEMKTGKVKWEQAMPLGHVILVGDDLLINDVTCTLHVVKANPEKFETSQKSRVLSRPGRVPPALSNGWLYLRHNAGARKAEMICVEVGKVDSDKK